MNADRTGEGCESGDGDGVLDVLAGRRSYDSLPPSAQAVVRARWSALLTDRIFALDMQELMRSAGHPLVELDGDDAVVRRQSD